MKFVDLVHAIKPNPVTDVPQAAAAHDRLWDWVANTAYSAHTQRVGVLIADGFEDQEVKATLDALEQSGAFVHVISERLGTFTGTAGMEIQADETFTTAHPVLFDAYYIVGGTSEQQKAFDGHVAEYFQQAYKYFKPIGLASTAQACLQLSEDSEPQGVLNARDGADFPQNFAAAAAQQRFWDRV